MKYQIQDPEAGKVINKFETFAEARSALLAYKKDDHKQGKFAANFYKISYENDYGTKGILPKNEHAQIYGLYIPHTKNPYIRVWDTVLVYEKECAEFRNKIDDGENLSDKEVFGHDSQSAFVFESKFDLDRAQKHYKGHQEYAVQTLSIN